VCGGKFGRGEAFHAGARGEVSCMAFEAVWKNVNDQIS